MNKDIRDKYQEVIGLEVHVQLLTKTKAYSSDTNEYGALPNTNISYDDVIDSFKVSYFDSSFTTL